MNEKLDVSPMILPIQVYLILVDKPTLMALYLHLKFLNNIGLLPNLRQSDLSVTYGISTEYLSTQLSELERLKLIEKVNDGHEKTIRLVYPSHVGNPTYLRKLLSMGENVNSKIIKRTVDSLSKSLQESSKNRRIKLITLSNILSNYNINVLSSISENKRYPDSQYRKVIEIYEKLTKVKLNGPELKRFRDSVRSLFHAGHSVKDIYVFMKWLESNRDEKRYWFAKDWNIRTVKDKIAEFKAGRFDESGGTDDFEQL